MLHRVQSAHKQTGSMHALTFLKTQFKALLLVNFEVNPSGGRVVIIFNYWLINWREG